jgi:hypothetical protein
LIDKRGGEQHQEYQEKQHGIGVVFGERIPLCDKIYNQQSTGQKQEQTGFLQYEQIVVCTAGIFKQVQKIE